MARILIAAKTQQFVHETSAALGDGHDYAWARHSEGFAKYLEGIGSEEMPELIVISPSIAGHQRDGVLRIARLLDRFNMKNGSVIVADNTTLRSTAFEAGIKVVGTEQTFDLRGILESVLQGDSRKQKPSV